MPDRPNILLIHTDQQRWDALGANGNPDIKTPNLDRLAATGLNFDHYFVQNAVCMPSRVSMLSGQYPATLGIMQNGVPVPEDTVTLPRLLQNCGYRSANIGKLHFLPHANRDHRQIHPDYGFDHLEISDEPGCYEDAYRAWVRWKASGQLDSISVGLPPAAHAWYEAMGIIDPVKHPTTTGGGARFDFAGAIPFAADEALTHSAFVADRTIEFLRQQGNCPFLCVAGFYSPHAPWVVPQRYLSMYDPREFSLPEFPPGLQSQRDEDIFSEDGLRRARHGYYAMITEVDHYVGSILNALDEFGFADNTIVIFTSDHGEWLGEHLKYGKGYPAHDCISRVPFIIRWPGRITEPGTTIGGMVEAVDVLPTLLECAGIPIPPQLQGRSFARVLHEDGGGSLQWVPRESALTEMSGWKTLRLPGFRYVVRVTGDEQLFDLASDPAGYRNVATDTVYQEVLGLARQQLITHMIERERPLLRQWPY